MHPMEIQLSGPPLPDGKLDDEAGAAARAVGFGPYRAAVGFHYLLGDIETIAGRVDVGLDGILAVSAFGKEFLLVLVSNADPAVLHRKANAFLCPELCRRGAVR